MKDFIQVKYKFLNLDENNINPIHTIGTEGFLLYHYFLYEQGNKPICNLSIRMIQEFLNRDYDKRPIITYTKNKCNPVSLMKSKKTIVKYLKILVNNKYIKIHNGVPSNINKPMIIQCVKTEETGFDAFPIALFINKIHRMGHIGFTILCLLGKNFNSTYGTISCEGFANPSEEYISKVTNRDFKTVRAYLRLLESQKLIKIKKQPAIVKGVNEYNYPIYEFINNHYEVGYKMQNNKYYLGENNIKKKDHND